jgi:hypothetical protein
MKLRYKFAALSAAILLAKPALHQAARPRSPTKTFTPVDRMNAGPTLEVNLPTFAAFGLVSLPYPLN